MPQLLLNPTSLSASTSGSSRLNEALFLLERRFAAWRRDPVAFHALLEQVFGVPPRRSAESAALLTTISGSGLGISLQILDSTTIDGLIAVYTSAAPDGDERIYINADWLGRQHEQIEAVLSRTRPCLRPQFNGTSDSAGDEGAIFSAVAENARSCRPRKRPARPQHRWHRCCSGGTTDIRPLAPGKFCYSVYAREGGMSLGDFKRCWPRQLVHRRYRR